LMQCVMSAKIKSIDNNFESHSLFSIFISLLIINTKEEVFINMLKKAAAQASSLKDQMEKLGERLKKNVDDIDELMKATNVPQYTAVPDHNVMANLLEECEDSDFW
jgi:hypothetical protein